MAAQLKVSSPWERIKEVEIMLLHMSPVQASAWILLSNPSMQISFSWLAKYDLKEIPQMLSGFRCTFCNLPLAHLSLSLSLSLALSLSLWESTIWFLPHESKHYWFVTTITVMELKWPNVESHWHALLYKNNLRKKTSVGSSRSKVCKGLKVEKNLRSGEYQT
jgi:hypothetical protein